MALIVLTTYCTRKNQKLPMLESTLGMLLATVDWDRHRIVIVDNASQVDVRGAVDAFQKVVPQSRFVANATNVGTARGFNLGHSTGNAVFGEQHTLKLDDDVVVHKSGWLDLMELALSRRPRLGGISLKWRMLSECPDPEVLPPEKVAEHSSTTSLEFLCRKTLDDWWTVIEISPLISGMCALYHKRALAQIGQMYQPSIYGQDDVLMCKRLTVAGWKLAFLPQVRVDHIDPGNTEWSQWKRDEAGRTFASPRWREIEQELLDGKYYSPDGETLEAPHGITERQL